MVKIFPVSQTSNGLQENTRSLWGKTFS